MSARDSLLALKTRMAESVIGQEAMIDAAVYWACWPTAICSSRGFDRSWKPGDFEEVK